MNECKKCRGTGMTHIATTLSGERVFSKYLDCAAPGCNAAAERAALNAEFPLLAKDWPDSIWQIHQRARKIERESGSE